MCGVRITCLVCFITVTSNERDGVLNYQHHDCLRNRLCADQKKHQSSVSQAFVRGIHWWPVNSPHKGPVTRKMFPFDNVIMFLLIILINAEATANFVWLWYNKNNEHE